jgi:hypothetical protein
MSTAHDRFGAAITAAQPHRERVLAPAGCLRASQHREAANGLARHVFNSCHFSGPDLWRVDEAQHQKSSTLLVSCRVGPYRHRIKVRNPDTRRWCGPAHAAACRRDQSEATGRHVDDLAREFAAILEHVAAEEIDLHPLVSAVLAGQRRRCRIGV